MPCSDSYAYIRKNLDAVKREILAAEEKAGRSDEVTLVCVTKSGSDDEFLALLSCGALHIGENRPQELARRGELAREHGYAPILHEIGQVQTSNVKKIVGCASLVQSLDRIALAEELERRAAAIGKTMPVLVEVNSGEEEQKGGVMPCGVLDFCRALSAYPHLSLRGLMTMGPVLENAEDYRPYFRKTKRLFDEAVAKFAIERPILSMGMSHSFAVAVEEGATLVRVGRRLFEK